MEYTAVAQGDTLPAPRVTSSQMAEDHGHRQPSLGNDGDDNDIDRSLLPDIPSSSRLSSLLRSVTSTQSSYAMVEDDDYEAAQVTPLRVRTQDDEHEPTLTRTDFFKRSSQSASPERTVPYRTASINRNLPLSHPTPDLQSLQGAYTKNVERLEESAERLSMTSSLDEELQRMRLEQRRPHRQSSAASQRSARYHGTARKYSNGSTHNQIIDVNNAARTGGYSPSAYITSPHHPVFSGSWSQPSQPGRPASKGSRHASGPIQQLRKSTPLDFGPGFSAPLLDPSPLPRTESLSNQPVNDAGGEDDYQPSVGDVEAGRPPTSASNDTYQRATNLFVDFDGVHFTPHNHAGPGRQTSRARQLSLTHPPLASDCQAFKEPQAGERMVYYPAPVPMMLNLPQKLSKGPSGIERERRRLQGISEVPDDVRKSAAWLHDDGPVPVAARQSTQNLAGLPPQLRASAFFDQPAAAKEVEVKEASAVATLDSILNASALAPVSAFTDHPIAGQVGREVYGTSAPKRLNVTATTEKPQKAKRRSSISNMLRSSTGLTPTTRLASGEPADASGRIASRESKAFETELDTADADRDGVLSQSNELDRAARQSIEPGEDELSEAEEGFEDAQEQQEEEEEEGEEPSYSGAPTTLLAELQMRKAQQKQRNRTAANAFPNGMRSTLLELDAIAQLQQKSRKLKHVTLAWEDHAAAEAENFEDDDVPLGLLVPQAQNDVNRPIGLLEKRDIEDNEPLSSRRARLRGEPIPLHSAPTQRKTAGIRSSQAPQLEDVEEQESETLGQRLKRLRAQKETKPDVAADFMNEVSSQLGLKTEAATISPKLPEAEETLGQRRKRLQQESLVQNRQVSGGSNDSRPSLKPRHSLADVLSAHPAAGAKPYSKQGRGLAGDPSTVLLNGQLENISPNTFMPGRVQTQFPYNNAVPYSNPAFNYGSPVMYNSPTGIQYAHAGMPPYVPDPMNGPPLDPKSRIDNWRQGVVQ